jgi:hypothetical protein
VKHPHIFDIFPLRYLMTASIKQKNVGKAATTLSISVRYSGSGVGEGVVVVVVVRKITIHPRS